MSNNNTKSCPKCGYPWTTDYTKCPSCNYTPLGAIFTPEGAGPGIGEASALIGYSFIALSALVFFPYYIYWLLFKGGIASQRKNNTLCIIPFYLNILFLANYFGVSFILSFLSGMLNWRNPFLKYFCFTDNSGSGFSFIFKSLLFSALYYLLMSILGKDKFFKKRHNLTNPDAYKGTTINPLVDNRQNGINELTNKSSYTGIEKNQEKIVGKMNSAQLWEATKQKHSDLIKKYNLDRK